MMVARRSWTYMDATFVRDQPLVSCVCVTRGRAALLTRSIQMFAEQCYPNLELIVACDEDDLESISIASSSGNSRVRVGN